MRDPGRVGLWGAGFHCQVAMSGKQGGQIIENGVYDIYIIAIAMNDVDGLGILDCVKQSLPDGIVNLITRHGTIPPDVDDLPEELADSVEPEAEPSGTSLARLVGKPVSEIEKLFLAETLGLTGGNREEAARMLGIGERTLYLKIKEYEL